jgi:phosphohistidine swiveling domain-containing protein
MSISYRRVEATYFPAIISDEAMTSEAMKRAVGVRYELPHVSVKRHGMFERFWHETDFVRARKQLFAQQLEHNDLQKFADKVNEHYSLATAGLASLPVAATSDQLYAAYHAVCGEYRSICNYAYAANLLDRVTIDSTKAELRELNPEAEAAQLDESLLILTRNPNANFLYTHDLELIELLQRSADDAALEGHIQNWKTLFRGNISSHDQQSAGDEGVRERLDNFQKLSPADLTAKQRDIKQQYTQAEYDIQTASEAINLSPQLEKKLALLRGSILLKETRKFCMTRLEAAVAKLFERIAANIGISPSHIGFMLPDEVKAALQGKPTLSDQQIDRWKNNLAYVIADGVAERFVDAQVDETIAKYQLELQGDAESRPATGAQAITEYHGFVSCLGSVEGPVRIVTGRKDFAKVQAGDILVTPITTPEFVAIFDKVAGMITYDGAGITSHPATLSREYKIPAILGIKELNGALQDGDIVSVDANANTVRIIKKGS